MKGKESLWLGLCPIWRAVAMLWLGLCPIFIIFNRVVDSLIEDSFSLFSDMKRINGGDAREPSLLWALVFESVGKASI